MIFPTPSLEDLQRSFEELSSSTLNGIPGVERINGSQPGPNVAITLSTHGNEPSGYAPYWYVKNVRPSIVPEKGSLTFIANNIEASKRSFAARTAEERRALRFVDVNMNRLPEDILTRVDDARLEVKRALELYPVFQDIDIALDIHSTVQPSDPMIIQIKGEVDAYTRGMPIQVSIDNIVPVQTGIPIGALYGGISSDIPVFEIEAGYHEDPQSFQLAIRSAVIFLLNAGLLDEEMFIAVREELTRRKRYVVTDSVFFPDASYELARAFPMFGSVRKGEIIARGNGDPIVCPQDGHAIFSPATPKPIFLNEEVLFLTDPVREELVS